MEINNFNLLRLMAATGVILQHSVYLSTNQDTLPTGFIGVLMFFLISGYLITASWVRNPAPLSFLKNRALRIFPALIVATLVIMFVIGPLMTTLPLDRYLSQLHIPIPILGHDSLPGVFQQTSVMGQTWTIPYELVAYLLVLGFGLFGVLKKEFVIGGVLILGFQSVWILALGTIGSASFMEVMLMFFVGSAYYFFKDDVRFSDRISLLMLALLTVLIFTGPAKVLEFALLIAIPYLTFWFAFKDFHPLYDFVSRVDLSYGIYIYGYAIQQTIVAGVGGIAPIPLFIASMGLTGAVAYLSWTLIEKPALSLKARA